MKIFEKHYDSESIVDIERDVVEAMDVRFILSALEDKTDLQVVFVKLKGVAL